MTNRKSFYCSNWNEKHKSKITILWNSIRYRLNMAEKGVSSTDKDKASKNFLRQFRDKDSREFKQISASQFMDVWNHYDADGKLLFHFLVCLLKNRRSIIGGHLTKSVICFFRLITLLSISAVWAFQLFHIMILFNTTLGPRTAKINVCHSLSVCGNVLEGFVGHTIVMLNFYAAISARTGNLRGVY